MTIRLLFAFASTSLMAGLLAACVMSPIPPPATESQTTAPVASAPPSTSRAASIQLPDGEQCLFAGTGAGIGAEGKRLNYTCSDPNAPTTVILGDPQPGANGTWTVTQGVVAHDNNGFSLQSSEEVTATVAVVALPDGTWCSNTGQGAVPAFDGKRLNYSCGQSGDNETGLIGAFQIGDDGVWMAEEATFSQGDSGFVLNSSEMVAVTPIQLNLAGGFQCNSSGEGATLAFDGQRVNYTCSDPNAPVTGLLGDITQVQETIWSTEKATLAPGDAGFTLQSSEVITYRIEKLDLVSGMQCANPGQGATLAFDNKRLNYTCGEDGANTLGILGDVTQGDAGIWTAEEATISHGDSGFTLDSSALVTVSAIYGGDLATTGNITPTTAPLTATTASGESDATATPAAIGKPNPASENCTAQGGVLTIEQRGDGGEFGVCTFEDNRQCEEWALLRGQCPVGGVKVTGSLTPAGRYCAITGGEYADNGTTNADNEQGTCTFASGTTCAAADYYNGQCSP